MATKPLPTPEQLRQLLCYEQETGKLFWKNRPLEMFAGSKLGADVQCATWNSRWAGKEAFTATGPNGYRRGRVLSQNHQAHRVIWAMLHNAWPDKDVDHINGVRTDNRSSNLRLASRSENLSNTSSRAGSSSRFLGVCWNKQMRKWVAQISHQGKRRGLGYFEREEDAALAYNAEAKRLFGEFSRPNEL